MTDELTAEFLAGNLYLIVPTAANGGGGIRGQFSLVEIATGIKPIKDILAASRDVSLLQNFPNPFNPRAEIQFDLNQPGLTVLKIYNLTGPEVATLVNEDPWRVHIK